MENSDIYVDKIWEKCARRLMLNSKEKLDKLLAVATKILGNIKSTPTDPKYRTLRFSNQALKSALFDVPGGLELLSGIGFESRQNEIGEKVLSGDLVELESIEAALFWLENTIRACQSFKSSDQLCADCVVQVRLPTGSSVAGGFLRSDTMRDVKEFAACYFMRERAASVYITLPDVSGSVGEQMLDSTLEELGLCPRAVVLASVFSTQERGIRLAHRHENVGATHEEEIKLAVIHKRHTVESRRELDEERSKILSAFKEDHNR